MSIIENKSIWLFHGSGGRFASAVFTSVDKAEAWIRKYKLDGILTEYPLDVGVYDWSIENGIFDIKKEEHTTSIFIQKFTSAGQEHFHYENGKREE
ncbi:DUF7710 domain-containing protein [Pararcticibacter amylolyticus]|uniref:DUF7710 domain-containing protein n=1 Tax=Pararcticibacter amylolyticus TaxID=2173175 RepID=A0A2U2P973_9SPHI|nr:hypothetical protein [Pararcticibacter amylolyticus]PWG77923.1 hypothetical protein DDR33_24955 [Pararcticibacter amylolyticus]